MNNWQQKVGEFHRRFNHPINTTGEPSALPDLNRRLLRYDLIREESAELLGSLIDQDLPGTVDGMCDLIYVVLGAALEMGIDLEPFFNEVHRTNMEKIGGAVRQDGKTLKPEGWKPPQIAEMIANGAGLIR
jgi:predicted HAD superfamily Cof-like phosphohydrolase